MNGFYFHLLLLILPIFTLDAKELIHLNGRTSDILNVIKSYLPPNPVIIEAGANNGTDSLQMATVWPEGHLYCFEPVPEIFYFLRKNTRSYKNIQCYQKALSDFTGYTTFYLSSYVNNDSIGPISGSGSLLPPKEHLKYDPNIYFPSTTEVETITLDEWSKHEGINHIDFLWLDMQGYELNMLKASELIKNARVIYTEVIFVEAYKGQYLYEDVKIWMEANGFELIGNDFTKNAWFGNALFLKKDI